MSFRRRRNSSDDERDPRPPVPAKVTKKSDIVWVESDEDDSEWQQGTSSSRNAASSSFERSDTTTAASSGDGDTSSKKRNFAKKSSRNGVPRPTKPSSSGRNEDSSRKDGNKRPIVFSKARPAAAKVATVRPESQVDFVRPADAYVEGGDFDDHHDDPWMHNPFFDGPLREGTDSQYRVKGKMPALNNIHFVVDDVNDVVWYKVPRWLDPRAVQQLGRGVKVDDVTCLNIISLTKTALYTNEIDALSTIAASLINTSVIFPSLGNENMPTLLEDAKDMFVDENRTRLLVELAHVTSAREKGILIMDTMCDLLLFWSPLIHDMFVKKPAPMGRWLSRIPPSLIDRMINRPKRMSGHDEDVHRFVVVWVASFADSAVDSLRMGLLMNAGKFSPYEWKDGEGARAIDLLRTSDRIKTLMKEACPYSVREGGQGFTSPPSLFTVMPAGDTFVKHTMTDTTRLVLSGDHDRTLGVLGCASDTSLFACFEDNLALERCTLDRLKKNGIQKWYRFDTLPRSCARSNMQMICYYDRFLMFVGGKDRRGAPADLIDVFGEQMERGEAEKIGYVLDMERGVWLKFDCVYRWLWCKAAKWYTIDGNVDVALFGKVLGAAAADKNTMVRVSIKVKDLTAREIPRFVKRRFYVNEAPVDFVIEDCSLVCSDKTKAIAVVGENAMWKYHDGSWAHHRIGNGWLKKPVLYDYEGEWPRVIGGLHDRHNLWFSTYATKLNEVDRDLFGEVPPPDVIQRSVQNGYSEQFEDALVENVELDENRMWPPCAILPLHYWTNCDAWVRRR